MSTFEKIYTEAAPAAIGPYSQAIKVGDTVFLSGQIPLVPETMEIVEGGIEEQTHQVFANLIAVTKAAGGGLENLAKLTIFLTDLNDFAVVNKIMAAYFSEPYPARATIEVSALPKGVTVEIDAIMAL
jgi:reactive intermediate/imine deaminase|tara:strand:+ start:530 stop:913 length:384 start_codon:yes stop_codon:yes gene_type:complete